jgi:hypothetical protein
MCSPEVKVLDGFGMLTDHQGRSSSSTSTELIIKHKQLELEI